MVCGSGRFTAIYTILLRCADCGYAVADLDMAVLSPKLLYDSHYFFNGEYLHYLRDESCHRKNFSNRLGQLLKFVSRGALLEIGSAYGFFLAQACRYFKVTGYEVCQEAASYARAHLGLDVRSTDFLADHLDTDAFDAVVMWDVLEHLPRPDYFIKKSWRILKKNGILALTTGDIESPLAMWQGKDWRLIHPPTHLHYFSKRSLCRWLQKNRFEVLRVSYPGYWRSLGQVIHGMLKSRRSFSDHYFDRSYFNIPIFLNTFDIMQVFARKA